MVKLLSKYIFRQVFVTSLSVGFIIVAALWVIQSLRFVELVLNARSTAWLFFQLALLALPDLLAVVLPVAAFISILFVYHRLIIERETVVMHSAGISRFKIARPAIVFSIVLMFCLYGINIFLSPQALRSLRDIEIQLRHALPAVLLQEGVFNTFGNTTVYVQKKHRDHLLGIFAYIHEKGKNYAVMAHEGKLLEDKEGSQILMVDGNRQELDPKTQKLSILYFDQTLISLGQPLSMPGQRNYKPYELEIGALLFPDPKLPWAEQQKLRAEGHQRLIAPLLVVAFVIISLYFMLIGRFRRHTLTRYILGSVITVVVVECVVLILSNLGAQYPAAIWANYIFVFMVCIVGASLLCSFTAKGRPNPLPSAQRII